MGAALLLSGLKGHRHDLCSVAGVRVKADSHSSQLICFPSAALISVSPNYVRLFNLRFAWTGSTSNPREYVSGLVGGNATYKISNMLWFRGSADAYKNMSSERETRTGTTTPPSPVYYHKEWAAFECAWRARGGSTAEDATTPSYYYFSAIKNPKRTFQPETWHL